MLRGTIIIITICLAILFTSAESNAYKYNVFDQLKVTVPNGYMYGKIPRIYKKWLKGNPWIMEQRTVKKLADKIYPGGDYSKIAHIHMTIIANKKKPYNDDIVCYMILYHDMHMAKKEIKKLNEFVNYNADRAIVLTKGNMAIFLHVDDTFNYHYIQTIAAELNKKLKNM